MKLPALPLIMVLLASGCTVLKDKILVSTSTILGFEVAQNPASQAYQMRFGYARYELAVVPTNGVEVLTELQFKNVTGQGGLYQRMAVGKEAIKQSLFVFAKDGNGTLNPQVAETVSKAITGIPAANSSATAAKVPLAEAYRSATDKTPFNLVAQALGYISFEFFLLNTNLSAEQVQAARTALVNAGVTLP